jgi:hypothetical protein
MCLPGEEIMSNRFSLTIAHFCIREIFVKGFTLPL